MRESEEQKTERIIKLKSRISEIVSDERTQAIEMHGYFNSDHEGYAVLKEEYEETSEALENANIIVETSSTSMWRAIREDDERRTMMATEAAYEMFIDAAAEAIQSAAMCVKILDSMVVRKENEDEQC